MAKAKWKKKIAIKCFKTQHKHTQIIKLKVVGKKAQPTEARRSDAFFINMGSALLYSLRTCLLISEIETEKKH
jgi:hypothetical protein